MSEQTSARYLAAIAVMTPLIEEHIDWSQRERRLHPAVVDSFHDAGLFRLMVPKELGGEGMAEHELLPMIEAVSRIDASAGWNLAIGNGSLGFVRGLDESAAMQIFATPRALAAAAVGVGFSIQRVDDGFRVSGRGSFASGCSQANWLSAGGVLVDANGPVLNPAGAPTVLISFFPADQAEIVDTWNVTGLRGTGSHDLVVRNLLVPATRVVDFGRSQQTRFDPFGIIPIPSRLGSHLTAVAIGATWHALEELKTLAGAKASFGTRSVIRDRSDVQIAVGRATGLVDAARVTATAMIASFTPQALRGEPLTLEDLVRIRLSYVTAASLCLDAVNLVHAAAGTTTLPADSVIGRCWRDVHAVSQHVSQQFRHFETAGRVMLGLPPEGPV